MIAVSKCLISSVEKTAHRGVVKDSVTAAMHKGVKMEVAPLRLIWYFLPF